MNDFIEFIQGWLKFDLARWRAVQTESIEACFAAHMLCRCIQGQVEFINTLRPTSAPGFDDKLQEFS